MQIFTPIKGALAGVAIFALLALAPGASAQDSSEKAYGGIAGETQSKVDTGAGNREASADGVAGLPFTGLDLFAALGGGLILLASGVALSRLVGRESAA